jgi:type I restriction enzyme, S subunit
MTNDWQDVPLKEVAKPISRSIPVEAGTEYRTIGVKWWGMGAYARETIDGSRTAAKTLSIVREGDLIINKIWVRHGSVAIAGKDVDGCAGSGEFPTFELDLNRIDPRWIHWQTKMKSFWEKCDSLSQGTSGKNRIKPELFLTIKIPLPPLDEQHHILEQVETLAARIAKAHSLREEAQAEMEYLEASLLNKILGEKSRELPQGWEWKSASEFCVAVDCGSTPEAGLFSSGSGEVPFIKVYNLTFDGALDFSVKPTFVSAETHNTRLKRSKVYPGDVLTNIVGPPLGKVSIVPDTYPEWNINQAIVSFRVNKEIVDNKYLAYILQSPDFQTRTKATTKGTAGQDNITLSTCRRILMPIPPLDEQRRIVAYLDSVQARLVSLRQLQSTTGEELSALLPSVLDRAFKGEL